MPATIRDWKATTVDPAAASIVCTMPTHVSGDLLIAFFSKDGNTGGPSTPAGWTDWTSASVSGTLGHVFAKRATSGSETLTISYTSNESIAMVVAVKDVNGSTVADALSGTQAWNSTTSTAQPMGDAHSITPAHNDCLLFSFLTISVNGIGPNAVAPWVNLASARTAGNNACLSYTHQVTAAAITHPGYTAQALANDRVFMVAIRGSGTEKECYVDRGTTAATFISPITGLSADSGTWQTSGAVYTGAIGAWSVTGAGVTTATRSGPSNVQRTVVTCTASASTTNVTAIQLNFTSAKDLNGLLFTTTRYNTPVSYSFNGDASQAGVFVRLLDVDDDAKTWVVGGNDAITSDAFDFTRCLIQVNQSTDTTFDTDLTLVATAVTRIQFGYSPYRVTSGSGVMAYSELWKLGTTVIAGGSSGAPIGFDDFTRVLKAGTGNLPITDIAGNAVTMYARVKVGGADPVHVSINQKVFQFPTSVVTDGAYDGSHFDSGTLGIEIAGISGDTIDFGQCIFTSSTPYYFTLASGFAPTSFDITGATIIGANVTMRSGVTIGNTSFINCPVFTQNSAVLNGTTFQGTKVSSNAPGSIDNCSFTSAGTGHAIEISATGTVTMEGNTYTSYGSTGSTDAAIYNNSGGAVTINLGQGDTAPTYRNGAGASTTINAYVDTFTLNSSESGSLIQIFTTGTQTVLDSATGTQVTFDHAGNTVDYVVQKAGFLPQRVTGYLLAGSPTITVTLQSDAVYQAGHGLILNTDYAYNATTRVLTLAAAEQGREIYSALIEDFISESAYFNKPFPLLAIGIDRIDFTSDGTTAATLDSGDIQYWRGAGMEWEHATTGNKTHKFCSIKGTGTNAANTKGYYQQVDGAAPTALTLVSNNVDQVIRYYRDDNGDGDTADASEYNYSGHLVIKLFNDGYYQIASNILTAYGVSAIESFEYVIPMQMTSTGLGTGTRGITIVVTDTTPAGTEYQTGYTFDYKIEGGASDSPSDLLRQWIYDVFTDPTASTYASKINFNWPDPLVESGGSYSTQYGYVYGQDTTTTFHGFYVEEGAVYHPDFLRQQANDGSYFTTPVLANVSITGMPTAGGSIRLQITNVTALSASAWASTTAYTVGQKRKRSTGIGTEQTAGLYMVCTTAGTSGASEPTWNTTPGGTTTDDTVTWTTYAILFYNANPSSSAYSTTYTDGRQFSSGDTYRIRFAEMNAGTSFKTYATTGVTSSSGFSVVVSTTTDSVFATNAVDGSTLESTFSPNFTSNYIVLDSNTDFQGIGAYAYYCYTLTTANGMYLFWDGVTALDVANYRINTATLNLYFDESGGFVKQTDSVRIFRDDNTRPALDPTTGGAGVAINWQNPVYAYDGGGGGFTSGDRATLDAITGYSTHSAADVATAIQSSAQTTPLHVDLRKVTGTAVTGAGSEADPWGP